MPRRPLPGDIQALRIAVSGGGSEAQYTLASEQLHHPCYNLGCHGGGLDLDAKVREMAEHKETHFRGEMLCHGHESMGRYSQSCLRGFTVDVLIDYGGS